MMTERWHSPADMVSELGLLANPDDRAAVRAEIRKALSEIHPDKTGGTFPGGDQKARYHLLQDAMDYLDSGHQLAPNPPGRSR